MKVGIFDSGLGGLPTCFDYPNDNILYLADNLNFPYNLKTEDFIFERTIKAINFFKLQNCDKVDIACNTAYTILKKKKHLEDKVKLEGVVDKIIHNVIQMPTNSPLVIIGTMHTINSKIYQDFFSKRGYPTKAYITPNLATIAEEFLITKKFNDNVFKKEFENIEINKNDTLILACTHYPLIVEKIYSIIQKETKILDGSGFKKLDSANLDKPNVRNTCFFSSLECERFNTGVKNFLNNDIIISKIDL